MVYKVALFGESQKGEFRKPYFCDNLIQLAEHLGEPPSSESKGLSYAIQALLFKYQVIFFRVHEEGFSTHDYFRGLSLLESFKDPSLLSAICLPGVGNSEIIEATTPICNLHKTFLILTERDLYDYLTFKQ